MSVLPCSAMDRLAELEELRLVEERLLQERNEVNFGLSEGFTVDFSV